MTSCVSVSTLGFAIERLVSGFKCRPHKSFFERLRRFPATSFPAKSIGSTAHHHIKHRCFVLLFDANHGTSRVTRHESPPVRQTSAPDVRAALLRRLAHFYEYVYTAESGGGFVFISSR